MLDVDVTAFRYDGVCFIWRDFILLRVGRGLQNRIKNLCSRHLGVLLAYLYVNGLPALSDFKFQKITVFVNRKWRKEEQEKSIKYEGKGILLLWNNTIL